LTGRDPGITVTVARDAVHLRGVAIGEYHPIVNGVEARYVRHFGLGFSLDADSVSAARKSARGFSVGTQSEETAVSIAQRLAHEVNVRREFRATVSATPDGNATVAFERLH
jgi:hypothetical protein